MQKLILEELEELTAPVVETDAPLTPKEKNNFQMGSVSDLLNAYLGLYNQINALLNDPALDEGDTRTIIESVGEDTAIVVGKLQEALKASADSNQSDLINQGAEEAQNITIESKEE